MYPNRDSRYGAVQTLGVASRPPGWLANICLSVDKGNNKTGGFFIYNSVRCVQRMCRQFEVTPVLANLTRPFGAFG